MRWALAVGVLALLAVEARALLSARAELHRAERASQSDDRIMHLRRAARWRAPLSPYPRTALDELRELALKANDPALALSAWEGIRGALLGSRVWSVPHPDRLREANRHIAALRSGAVEGENYDKQVAALERVRGPNPLWSTAALFGLGLWVAGGFLLPSRRRLGWSLVSGGLALFVAGLALA